MSVHLSPRQLCDPQLADIVHQLHEDTRLPGAALFLEVTESTLMEDAEATKSTVDALKELGVRLSADDFGTGYSSLVYLRLFPFDQAKIDRSLVHGVGGDSDDEVIVGAVLSMAKALSLSTVAEGVETATQRDRVSALGTAGGQGWLFSAPLLVPEVIRHLPAADANLTRAVAALTDLGDPT